MIIVESNGGQMCNRMWSYTSVIAHALNYKEKVVVLDFNDYLSFFPNLKSDNNLCFVGQKQRKWIKRLVRVLSLITKLKQFDYNQKNRSFVFAQGWEYRFDMKYFTTDTVNTIRQMFAPSKDVSEKCINLLQAQKANEDILLVGVHIRRGDYKTFANGKYYFSNADYLSFINDMKRLYPTKKMKFLLCSNENIDIKDFTVDCFQVSGSSAIEDLYSLSLCDYIMGPPSTFSMWASFYGNKPLLEITERKEILVDKFRVICELI